MKIRLRNNPALHIKGGGRLPNDYIEVEYIESTGTQYIDTDINETENLIIECKYSYNNWVSNGYLFGNYQADSYNNTRFILGNSDNASGYCSVNSKTNITITPGLNIKNTIHTLILSQESAVFDGTTIIGSTTAGSSNLYSIALFGNNNYGTITATEINARIYYFKIYDGEILVRDFVPALRNSDSEPGLYDLVSEEFFTNQGADEFLYGNPGTYSNNYLSKNTLENCEGLLINGCAGIDNNIIVKSILKAQSENPKLERIRVDGINITNGTYSDILRLSQLKGYYSDGRDYTKPRLEGTYTINEWITPEMSKVLNNKIEALTIKTPKTIDWNEVAIQTLDPEKPNYNPAAAIILNENKVGDITSPIIEGKGKYILTKSQAALITSIDTWFKSKTSVIDNKGIVSPDKLTYSFDSFDEFNYFTGLTTLNNTAFQDTECFANADVILGDLTPCSGLYQCKMKSLEVNNSLTLSTSSNRIDRCPNIVCKGSLSITNSNAFYNSDSSTTSWRVKYLTVYGIVGGNANLFLNDDANSLQSGTILHFAYNGIAISATRACASFSRISKIYVGDGSSEEHDQDILDLYLEDSDWSVYSSKLDTWWNYCQSNYPSITIENKKVTIKGTYRSDSKIYYTLDGSNPDETSNLYTEPFDNPGLGLIIKAIEIGDTWRTAIITSKEFTENNVPNVSNGLAVIDKYYGKSIVWNQLVNISSHTENFLGVDYIFSHSDNSIKADGVSTGSNGGRSILTIPSVEIGHKVYMDVQLLNRIGYNLIAIYIYGTRVYNTSVKGIYTVRANANSDRYITISFNSNIELHLHLKLKIFDLTQMFGAGNEPSTVAEFEKLFPLDYYDYNAGQLLNLNPSGIFTNGLNQWDEEWESGMWYNGEKYDNANSIRSKNYIKCLSNTLYYIEVPAPVYITEFDINKQLITYHSAPTNSTTFTTLSNTQYLTFHCGDASSPVTTYNNDICLNLSRNGERDGEYESYWEDTLDIDITTIEDSGGNILFPNGLCSVGDTRDEITSTGATKKITKQTISGAIGDQVILAGCKTTATNYVSLSDYGTLENGILTLSVAVSEKDVFYELETPITVEFDTPIDLTYRVSKYGIERLLPINTTTLTTTPIRMDVVYK